MVTFETDTYSRDDWRAHCDALGGGALVQDWAYGAAKAATGPWSVERGVLRDGSRTIGAVQVLIRRLPGLGGGLAWINRGPLMPDDARDTLIDAVLRALADHYAAHGHYLRIAPTVAATSLPVGWFSTGTAGWASAALDLTPEEDTLRSGLAQKWRNALNKAERMDLEIAQGSDGPVFDTAIAEYRAYLKTAGFSTTVTPELLIALRNQADAGDRLLALRATQEGEAAGFVLIARYGASAEYLAGHMTDLGRKTNAGQLLLWQAALAMKQDGRTIFDLGGMDPHITPKGILHFKQGLGGTPYRLPGEIEAAPRGLRARLVQRLMRSRGF